MGAGQEKSPQKDKENPMNRVLDEKNFDGEGFRCLSAAQATSQRFKGSFLYNKKI